MPTDKEFAEMSIEAESEMQALFDEFTREAAGKRRRKAKRVEAQVPQLEAPQPPLDPMAQPAYPQ